ncbi:MAG: SRPBCC family protein [Aquihabitans sp.]
MTEVFRTRNIAGTPAEVWEVLSDFGAISKWAPNVDHSSLQQQPGGPDLASLGLVRRIQTGRRTLLERVVRWDEPRALAYEIEGLPKVVRSLRNEWTLVVDGDTGTTATLATRLDCGPRPPQQLGARILGRRLAKESDQLLLGLAHFMEDRVRG